MRTSPAKECSQKSAMNQLVDDNDGNISTTKNYGDNVNDVGLLVLSEAAGHGSFKSKSGNPAPTEIQQDHGRQDAANLALNEEQRDERQDEQRPSDISLEEPSELASCSDDESVSSAQSYHSHGSLRDLLKQAQQRVEHQSVYEEVKALRVKVEAYKLSEETTLRQKADIQNRCNAVEMQLDDATTQLRHGTARAADAVRTCKSNEVRWNTERAEMERDFMNQLNATCATMAANEKKLMGEIGKRDVKIVELTDLWSKEVQKRTDFARERENSAREREIDKFI